MNNDNSSQPAVHLASIGIEMAPDVITSAALEDRLAAPWSSMGIAPGQLEQLTGVRERRWWPEGTSISAMAARACQKALESSHLPASAIGQLAYTGVCREAFEPATACSVAARLDLSRDTALHDISNACLGAIDGVVMAADAIRLGRIEAALVVCCESARSIVNIACQKLLSDSRIEHFIPSLATLTGGSGAAAMLLVSSRISTEGPVFLGSSVGTDARWHELCRWGVEPASDRSDSAARIEFMETDSVAVLKHGVELGKETWSRFLEEMGWSSSEVNRTICHQVGSAHRDEILAALELSHDNDFITYPFLGNMGTVSIPMTAALAAERGILSPGQKVAFLGIGSGLVCRMIGWQWR
ncbi:MAG: 3-oxoacyl-ACP synthase III [Planctomycetota bacterium]|nr:3-oxoacyl-ACP synthase III [Planctomycetota bacterium]